MKYVFFYVPVGNCVFIVPYTFCALFWTESAEDAAKDELKLGKDLRRLGGLFLDAQIITVRTQCTSKAGTIIREFTFSFHNCGIVRLHYCNWLKSLVAGMAAIDKILKESQSLKIA